MTTTDDFDLDEEVFQDLETDTVVEDYDIDEVDLSTTELATVDDLTVEDIETETANVMLSNGKYVTVRPLTRQESVRFNGKSIRADIFERKLLSLAMVSPKMSEQDVLKWQKKDKADGDIEKVTNAIARISGMRKGAAKRNI